MLTGLLIAFGIVATCAVIHTSGLLKLADQLNRYIERQEKVGFLEETFILIISFSVILSLHLIEAGVWAMFYQLRELFPDFETSLYFSLTSYTTMGFGDVVLPQRWRLLGGIEGFSGVLLCGLSTAFLFVYVEMLLRFRRTKKQPAGE
jgi:voltage-gated potassium channel